MISFADFVIIGNGVSFIVDIIVFSRKLWAFRKTLMILQPKYDLPWGQIRGEELMFPPLISTRKA